MTLQKRLDRIRLASLIRKAGRRRAGLCVLAASAVLWFGMSSAAPVACANDEPAAAPENEPLDQPLSHDELADSNRELAARDDDDRDDDRRGPPRADRGRGDRDNDRPRAARGERGRREGARDDDRPERPRGPRMARRGPGGDERRGPPRFGGMRGPRGRGFGFGGNEFRREFSGRIGPGGPQGGPREVVRLLEDLKREIEGLRREVRQLREARGPGNREGAREERRGPPQGGEESAERGPGGPGRGPRGPFGPGMRGGPRRPDGPPDRGPDGGPRRGEGEERRPDGPRGRPASDSASRDVAPVETVQPTSTSHESATAAD